MLCLKYKKKYRFDIICGMKKNLTNNNYDLLVELVKTSFKLKYNDSILGFIWALLKPFLQFLILYVVFSNFAGNNQVESFTIYLLLGLVIFSFFQESIITGIHSLLDKSHIILKVNFDKTLVVYSTLFLAAINLFINFIIIGIFAVFNPISPNVISILYLVFLLVIGMMGVTAVTFFTSIITVRVRDLQHIAEVGMQLMFYATPIFYQIEIIPEQYRRILEYNPLYILIQAIRAALIQGDIIHIRKVLVLGIISFILYIWGYIFFKSKVTRIAEYF